MIRMPTVYAIRLLGTERTAAANRDLGFALAFVAGAVNACGYLLVERYTSHLTGAVATIAYGLAGGSLETTVYAVIAVLAFLLGAASCVWIVGVARRRGVVGAYAWPLLLEALLLMAFASVAASLPLLDRALIVATVMLLGFVMGLQNAITTKVSNAGIRTTHMTGVVTDLGLELGKRIDRFSRAGIRHLLPRQPQRLATLAGLLGCFVGGGVIGAVGFSYLGFAALTALATALALFAVLPVAAGRGAPASARR